MDDNLVTDVSNAAQKGEARSASGAVIEDANVLKEVGLEGQAAIEGVTQGLFLEAAAPVLSGDSVQGIVLLGQLVNNDVAVPEQSIVNEIKGMLYGNRTDAAVIVALTEDKVHKIVSTNLPKDARGGDATGVAVRDSGGTAPTYNEDVEFSTGEFRTSYMPIEGVDRTTGVHNVGLIGVAIKEDWFTALVRKVQFVILIVLLVALAIAITTAVVAAQRLTRPIVELTEAANRISLGELDVPITVNSDDEIGTLGESLDRMRISLKQAIERLRKR